VNHYSIRTEKTYWYWIRYFIRFHKMKHPRDMGPKEVNEFLTWLAVHHMDTLAKAWKQQSEEFLHPVSLPFALARKYPRAGHSLEWQ